MSNIAEEHKSSKIGQRLCNFDSYFSYVAAYQMSYRIAYFKHNEDAIFAS